MSDRVVKRLIAVGGLLVVAIVVVAMAGSNGDEDRRLNLIAPASRFIIPGLDVKAAGQPVGKVTDTEVTKDNQALLKLRIDDDAVWPLPQGTKARMRFAGTVKMSARYIELTPPAAGGPAIPNGGVLRATDVITPEDYVTTPQEFDDLFRMFDARTRQSLKAMLTRGGAALAPAADEFHRALNKDRVPSALEQGGAAIADLAADREALDTLVRSSDRVVAAIDSANPDVGRLVSGAGTTFAAVAAQSTALENALSRMPPTLTSVRRTLAHADGTLEATRELATRLGPGVRQLRAAAPSLEGVLRGLTSVGPDARKTLSTLRRATPDLNPFLTRARLLMPQIGSISKQAEKQLHCIRPFAPEIGNMFVVWTGYWGGHEPNGDNFARAMAGTFPWPNGNPMTPAQIHSVFSGIKSAFPRPPGQIVNQPWFIPECGITQDALDPSKDPEAMRLQDAVSKEFIQIRDPEPAPPSSSRRKR